MSRRTLKDSNPSQHNSIDPDMCVSLLLRRYRESQPVRTHLTPFEQRVAAKLCEEQQVAAAAAVAAGAEAEDAGSDVSSVGPQQLFSAASGTASRP